jgi:hypothetical protein
MLCCFRPRYRNLSSGQTLGTDIRGVCRRLWDVLCVAAHRVEELTRLSNAFPSTASPSKVPFDGVDSDDLATIDIATPTPTAMHNGGGELCGCGNESLWLVLQRWKKLSKDFYNERKDTVGCLVLVPLVVCFSRTTTLRAV